MKKFSKVSEGQLPKTYFDLMEKVGTDGPYQRNVFLIFFLNWFIAGLLIMQTAFLFLNYEFDCEGKGLAVSDCSRYVCSLPEQEWEKYFLSTQKSNLAINYGPFVCDNVLTVSLLKMTTFIGIFFGYIVILFFTDNYGRKLSVIMAWSITVVGLIILCASVNLPMAVVGLFLSGAGSESAIRISMAVFGEIVDYYIRQQYSVALQISFGIAGVSVGIIYYLIDDWRIINIFFIAIPAMIQFGLFIFYFQETPKFVIKKGIRPALKSLNRIGQINKNKKDLVTQDDITNVLLQECDDDKFNKIVTAIDIFRFPSLRTKSIGCCLIFILINYLYYGPLLIVQKLGFNPYVNQVVVAMSELLAYPIAYIFIKRMPRQLSGIISFGISVFFTTVLLFVEKPRDCDGCIESIIELICVFGSRFVVSYYFAVFFLYVTQLYPLRARGQGFGIASAAGAIAASSANVIFGFMIEKQINPMIFETICGILAILVLMFLPETHQKPLLDEIEEIQYEKNEVKKSRFENMSKFVDLPDAHQKQQ